MILSKKSLFFRLKSKISLLTALLTFTSASTLQSQEGCCTPQEGCCTPQEGCCTPKDPNEKQNIIVGSVAIALVGIGVAVALSGRARNNLHNYSSYLYSYSGGLTDWSSGNNYSDYSNESGSGSTRSAKSDKKLCTQENNSETVVESDFTLSNPLPKKLNIILTNRTDHTTLATISTPDGDTNTESLTSSGGAAVFSYDHLTITPGTYRFMLASSEKLPSGTELGTIEISNESGTVLEQIDVVAP